MHPNRVFSTCSLFPDKAPLSKSLLLVLTALSFLVTVAFQHYQKVFIYNLQVIKKDFQIWRVICGRIICLDLKDLFCSSLLIYNFRIFERRYGSKKFASFLLGSWVLSGLFDLLLVEAVQYAFGVKVNILPSGFLGPIFALFVPFYCSIPRVQVTQILGQFAITNKTLVYILGLQLLTSSSYTWIVALSGLVSGILYYKNVFSIQGFLSIPDWMAKFISRILGPLFLSGEPTHDSPVGMGATLDIQRQQRIELLDQQIMFSQFAQIRRNRHPQGGMINWNRLFPPLRHRHNANAQGVARPQQDGVGNTPQDVSEEQQPPSAFVNPRTSQLLLPQILQ
ncbi:ubiquitin-associated domain-containing protein 2 [Latimeria chalumnae]|uniref:ubiquitin-associated domain-containing protein 2 n=1 Tax=Latimeria chalumnae TaxID=7897 RepID=UPI00313A9A9E